MLGLFAMAVGCPFPECTYTIPDDVTDQQLMNTCLYGHIQAMHSGPSSAPHEATGKSRLEKISRPTITTGCSQDDFEFFKSEWDRYKAHSKEKDDCILRDHLILCADEGLRKTLHRTLGDSIKSTKMDELLKVIQEIAVVKQSELLNLVNLLEQSQDRGESIRQYVARLRGMANLCGNKLIPCSVPECNGRKTFKDTLILAALVKGLNDPETKKELLSKVTELALDETIAFVEARETGARSLSQLLPISSSSHHTNKVDVTVEKSCWRCLGTGHNGRDSVKIRKAHCKAFDAKCKRCNNTGHFA